MYEVRCRGKEQASPSLQLSFADTASDSTGNDEFHCDAVGTLSARTVALSGKRCRMRVLISPDWTPEDVQYLGRYGVVEIKEIGTSSPEEGESLFICSGRQQEDTLEFNCLIVSPNDHRRLVSLLRNENVVTASFQPSLDVETTGQVHPLAQSRRLSRLAHWAKSLPFVAAPFALPSAAMAECAAAGSGNYDSGTNYSGVDVNHIIQSDEGGNATSGYVPSSTSGVTIAGGLDLGVNSASDLQQAGVPQNLIDQFQPFLAPGPGQTVTGSAAQTALANNPQAAQISIPQANQINQAIYNYNANNVAVAFNNASPNMMFTDLNVQWQTVLVSMYFQSHKIVSTQFFQQAAHGQWPDAISNLQHFGGPSSAQNNRAAKNANYLKSQNCTSGT